MRSTILRLISNLPSNITLQDSIPSNDIPDWLSGFDILITFLVVNLLVLLLLRRSCVASLLLVCLILAHVRFFVILLTFSP